MTRTIMAVTDEQLLEMHRRALDTIRAVLDGLDVAALNWSEPATGKSITSEVRHICGAEAFWLRDAGLEPAFELPPEVPSSCDQLTAALDSIQRRWAQALADHPNVRMSLFRLCLHALYHLPRIVHFRARQQPGWALPHWSQPGSWEHAIEPILHVMLAERPEQADDQPTPGFQATSGTGPIRKVD